ncbi:MAG TPA: phospholipase C, phosphocholine-specific [Cyclobacteriaceae bacterium]|nr:phospholipase C, phosphocholine-specific [Cyclobacteriaceae bacterium]
MDSRRDFLKKTAMLSGAAGLASVLPPSIAKAFAIDPASGTTWKDAEHVVILMQENRSFDHCYGSLQGVRGFNDPRAMTLPNKNSVWLQSNSKGETFSPFRLNIKDTNATWMGSLPHGWTDQTDARNNGAYDKWLESKKSGHAEYKDMPLTLGFYNREDIPFYYSLADAFTVCDQNFCSSLTGTTPNRLHLWTGKTRDNDQSTPRVRNEETDYQTEASWKTFPERLEENDISWKIYQNELSVGVGFQGEEDPWLANFGDNPIEFFTQYNVRFLPAHMRYLPEKIKWLQSEIAKGEEKSKTLSEGEELSRLKWMLDYGKRELEAAKIHIRQFTPENYAKLSQREKNLHEKAFANNIGDPDYHTVTTLKYDDNGKEREMKVPKGDVFYQFRQDVKNGKLPAVSWLVAPENFSDHPSAPWYGAWYLSEAVDILTENPEIWKKMIFILCYDENDGYFDHVPPFVPPAPNDPSTGKVSKGIDLNSEYVSFDDDLKRKPALHARGGPIGLGYRVPLVIASPWSRGGAVCSQVFDHTSILMFLEKFLSHKTGKEIKETNISAWRRAVCGDLTSAFTPFNGEKYQLPKFVDHDPFVKSIHKAQFKETPSGFHALTPAEIEKANLTPSSSVLPRQEKGTRTSRALPYELYVDGKMRNGKYDIRFEAGKDIFGELSAGSPFQVHHYGASFHSRDYAVVAGDSLTDSWEAQYFNNDRYHFKVYGPNGFFREFKGSINDPQIEVSCAYEKDKKKKFTGNVELTIFNHSAKTTLITVVDNAYGQHAQSRQVAAGEKVTVRADLSGWYDLSVRMDANTIFENRFAGRVETGNEGISDPGMG